MWNEPKLDEHAFATRRSKAISATPTREGWDTPGISFADFGSMHVHRRKTQERRVPTPEWALNDEGTRRIVLRFCEGYVGIRKGSGTDAERMQAIREKAKAILPNKEAQLETALRQFHELNGAQPEGTHRDFSIQVQNRDTQIQILRRGLPEIVTSVVYLYYRLGWNSTAIAEQLKLKSPAVREWLYRMSKYAKGESPRAWRCKPQTPWPKDKVRHLFVMRLMGATFKECARELGVCAVSVAARWRQAFGDLTVNQMKAVKGKKRHRRVWTPEQIAKLAEMRKRGATYTECAFVLGFRTANNACSAYRYHCTSAI